MDRPIPVEAKQITFAVLHDPRLHWRSCYADVSGRPEFNCQCPIKEIVEKIQKLPETKEVV